MMRRLSLLVCVLGVGCSEPPSVYEALSTWPADPPAVLEVNGRKVSKAEFETYWARHPSLTKAEVTKALSVREALVGQALIERRGGAAQFDVARKRGLIRSLLTQEIESVEAPKGEDVSKFERLLAKPQGYRVSNLIVHPSAEIGPEDPALLAEAIRLSEILGEHPTSLELVKAKQEARSDLKVTVDLHFVFPAPNDTKFDVPPQWLKVDDVFAAEVEKGFGEKKTVAGPFKTQFGWHIVVLEEQISGYHPSADEVQAFASRVLKTEAQKEKFFALVKEELQQEDWTIYPEVLSKEEP